MTLLGLFRMTAAWNLMACGCVDGSCSCNSGKACCGKKGCVCKNWWTCLCDTKASKKTVTENRIDGTSVDTEFNKTTFVNGVPVYSWKKDNLKVIEWIGPVIEWFLNDHGIISFEQIGAMQPEEVKKILDRAKERFLTHTTESRPLQARFAAAWRKKELQEMKNELDGGKFIAGGKYTKDSV